MQDEDGRIWRDYRIKAAKPCHGSVPARYRLYEAIDNNSDWQLDFEKPNRDAWMYVCEHYRQIQTAYNFDFMRGDMSHVQMRPDGVPENPDEFYGDLQRAVKQYIRRDNPSFGFFAEALGVSR